MSHRAAAPRPAARRAPFAGTALLLAAILAACGGGPAASAGPSPEPGALRVVATTTVLADLVAQVGGPKVAVTSIVPKGGEVHTFDPTPATVQKIAEADLVIANGLGLDEWLVGLAEDAGGDAPIVELGEDLPAGTYLESDGEAHAGEEPGAHGGDEHAVNPHLWLDVANARAYAARIGEALAAADPENAAAYAAGAAAYDARLAELDGWVRERMATVPEANRVVVSFHEAFPYFAAAYGLEIIGTITDAPGQDPSAGEIADLVAAIRAGGARAVFAEAQFGDDLVRTIADETGATVVASLYNDSVGDAPADTYEGLMRWNVDRIVEALAG